MPSKTIIDLLGDKAESILNHKCKIDKSQITLPSPTHVDDIWTYSNRNNRVLQ
ncbi:MAG: fructose-bisphosphate aldolase, partial [Chitinophagaceae bacterium]|nr:fructose-bisphosphate aldolase [Chitinophagaceae bacterium]